MPSMGRRGDTRDRMIEGARELMRLNGYAGTSFKDIWQHAGTPRGSVYFHFPNGKQELGLEVIAASGRDFVAVTRKAGAASRTRQEFIRELAKATADEIESEGFATGCPVVAISMEMANTSPALLSAAERAFASWRQAIAAELRGKGVGAALAADVATLLVSSLEGARLQSRTSASRDPLDRVGVMLAGIADEPRP